jgi:hypothetical protein
VATATSFASASLSSAGERVMPVSFAEGSGGASIARSRCESGAAASAT